jgi:integrase
MPQKSNATVHILEGRATLFKRPNTPHWQLRYKAHGEWIRATTKCEELAEAKQVATDIVVEASYKEKHNLPIVNKRFKSVAKLTIRRLQELQSSGRGKETYLTYIQVINKYLIKFFGNHNVDKITNPLLIKFDKWRIEEMGRVPSASVLNNHNSALNKVFDEAIERGYMTKFQIPLLRNEGKKSERRPDFTIEDYVKLYKSMRTWAPSGRKGHERLFRETLRNYVLVLANTGIRAGTEAMNLRWKHVAFFKENDKKYLELHVDGKTGARDVIARHSVVAYLNRLRKLNPKLAEGTFEEFIMKRKNDYVFRINDRDMTSDFGKSFATMLKAYNLQTDTKTGKKRTLYSLRHYYATMALTYETMSVYTLAQHMGTSVKMIEDHYGHVLLRKKASSIAGDKKPKVQQNKKEVEQSKEKNVNTIDKDTKVEDKVKKTDNVVPLRKRK